MIGKLKSAKEIFKNSNNEMTYDVDFVNYIMENENKEINITEDTDGYYLSTDLNFLLIKDDFEYIKEEMSDDNTKEDIYNNKKNKVKYIKITNEEQSTYEVGNVYKANYIENCNVYGITNEKRNIIIGYIYPSDCIPINKKDLMVVGSKVKLKKKYYNIIDKKEINNFKGKILTIKNIYKDENGKWYDFEENDLFGWKQHMFKPYLDN